MGSSFPARRVCGYVSVLWLASGASSACSAPSIEPQANDHGGIAGQVAGSAGSGGLLSSGGSLTAAGGATSETGGISATAGAGNDAGGSHAGAGGSAASGPDAGAGASGGVIGGNGPGGGAGSGGTNPAVCQMVKTEYAAELEKQLACKLGASAQCANKVAAAPGCECRVFIQPADPFAIEHLSNVGNGWFDADCSLAICPAKCSTAAAGTCQADAKSPLGGRCVTP